MPSFPKHVVRGFAVTLLSEGVALACSIASFVVLVLLIPEREYGEYAGILGITTSVGALMWQGVPMAVLEVTARATDHWRLGLGRGLSSLVGSFPFALGLVAVLTHFMIPSARVSVALIVITGDFALWLTHSIAASRQVTKGMRAAASVRSTVAVLRAIGLVIGALISTRLVVVVSMSSLLSWIGAGCLLLRLHGIRPARPDRLFVHSLTGYQVGGAATSVQEEIDKTFVLRISGEIAAAQYSAVFRLFQVLALPLRALAGTLQARLVVEQDNPRAARKRLLKVSAITVTYGLVGWVVMGIASIPLTRRLPTRFGVDPTLFFILGAILPIRGMVPHAANLLIGLGRRKQRAAAHLVGAVVAVTLYVTLIPGNGPRGAAIASVVAELAVLVMLWASIFGASRKPAIRRRPRRSRRRAPRHLRA